MFKAHLLLCVLAFCYSCDGFKVLVVFPQPGRSHSILGYGVVKHLLEAGHDVTYITPFVEKNSHPKLRQIDVSSNFDVFPKDILNIKVIMEQKFNVDYVAASFLMNKLQVKTIENPNVQKILQDPNEKFDVVILEWLLTEVCVGYAALFDAPFIWLGSTEPHWQILRLIDEGLNPAYNGDALSGSTPPFDFFKRVEELWMQIKNKYYMYSYIDRVEKEEYERVFLPLVRQRGIQAPVYDEIKYNGSLILGNSHVSLGQATRIPQNFKPVGGYHIDRNVKPLPEDLQNLFDNAPHGIIYFSMGSNLKSKDMPEQMKKDILKVFSGLKQTVLWKFEEEFRDLPKNVHVVKWAPQPSILSHPNCLVFITHGGLLSTTEAIHFGVPIIGIPVFADQFVNIATAVNKGFARRVHLSYNMADDLEAAVQDILTNSRYREKVKELSLIYHDRPVQPGAELVHWVEHVVRTRGAPHLRSPALMIPWYQKIFLDLIVLVIFATILTVILCRLIYMYLMRTRKGHIKKNN